MKHKIILFAMLFLAFSNINLQAESDTLWTTSIGSTVRTVKFSPDGQYVYAAAQGRGPLQLDANNGNIVREYQGFKYSDFLFNNAIDISPDGRTVVGGDFHKLYLYDAVNGELKDSLESNTMNYGYNRFNDVLFTKDNKYVIDCIDYAQTPQNTSSKLLIWDIKTKKIINEINGSKILKIAQTENTSKLAYIDRDNSDNSFFINLLEIGTWKNIGVLKGHTSRITDLSFSPDGSLLSSCDDDPYVVKIWDIEKKEMLMSFKPNGTYTYCIELLSNNLLASSSGNWEKIFLRSNRIDSKEEVYSTSSFANEFEFYKNEKAVLSGSSRVVLLKADKLTSVSSDFTKDLIYPNPTTNIITIPQSYFEFGQTDISIVNISGVVLYQRLINDNAEHLVDVSKYPNATYYLNIKNSKISNTMRFIKE